MIARGSDLEVYHQISFLSPISTSLSSVAKDLLQDEGHTTPVQVRQRPGLMRAPSCWHVERDAIPKMVEKFACCASCGL